MFKYLFSKPGSKKVSFSSSVSIPEKGWPKLKTLKYVLGDTRFPKMQKVNVGVVVLSGFLNSK